MPQTLHWLWTQQHLPVSLWGPGTALPASSGQLTSRHRALSHRQGLVSWRLKGDPVWQFRADSKGTQPHVYMYPLSGTLFKTWSVFAVRYGVSHKCTTQWVTILNVLVQGQLFRTISQTALSPWCWLSAWEPRNPLPHPAPSCFPLRTGSRWLLLCVCESAYFLVQSPVCCIF